MCSGARIESSTFSHRHLHPGCADYEQKVCRRDYCCERCRFNHHAPSLFFLRLDLCLPHPIRDVQLTDVYSFHSVFHVSSYCVFGLGYWVDPGKYNTRRHNSFGPDPNLISLKGGASPLQRSPHQVRSPFPIAVPLKDSFHWAMPIRPLCHRHAAWLWLPGSVERPASSNMVGHLHATPPGELGAFRLSVDACDPLPRWLPVNAW